MKFNNLKIANKIYFLFALAVPVMCVVFGALYWKTTDSLYQERSAKVQSQTQSAASVINHFVEQEHSGALTREEAQRMAIATIAVMRYDGDDYFWINDSHPRMIMHPFNPSLNGKDLSAFADPDGVKLFNEMVNATRIKDADFVHYRWEKPGLTEPVAKVSYVQRIKAWDWIVGTGLYTDDIKAQTQLLLYAAVGIVGFTILASLVVVIWFARGLARPIGQVVHMLQEMSNGHISQRLNMKRQDEIGVMAATMDEFADNLEHELVDSMQRLAHGDLTFEIHPHDENDVIRGALKTMEQDLNEMVTSLQNSGEQIGAGASQIADASQSLSQGATESASSLEEISASINELASQTDDNAANATQAAKLSAEASGAANRGNDSMQHLVSAMEEISDSSQSISKIIKVIDEIAFQTNLLALNAAVEAARAGQHGKGFAVVAEEVRNLAARSAKAASETADLIEGSVVKAKNGADIAVETSKVLDEIVTHSTKVSDLIAEIAAASKEQALGISQVNIGISQIDDVTQQNTANAEEGAAAAEQLSSQAQQLRQMLRRFTTKSGAGQHTMAALEAPQQHKSLGWN
ncbi:MAG: methyl-accepting chemotaxis protein [Desulfuromonadaceae bacterium]|nr:methyl-accepting chemotaxis protein [Desulfuromonadaceae bacterium]